MFLGSMKIGEWLLSYQLWGASLAHKGLVSYWLWFINLSCLIVCLCSYLNWLMVCCWAILAENKWWFCWVLRWNLVLHTNLGFAVVGIKRLRKNLVFISDWSDDNMRLRPLKQFFKWKLRFTNIIKFIHFITSIVYYNHRMCDNKNI